MRLSVLGMSDEQSEAYFAIDWNSGACSGAGPDYFFPDLRSLDIIKLAKIRETCAGCPIRIECRDYGRAFETHGIWGGVALDDRLNDYLHRKMTWHRAKQRWQCAACRQQYPKGTKYRLAIGGSRYCEGCAT